MSGGVNGKSSSNSYSVYQSICTARESAKNLCTRHRRRNEKVCFRCLAGFQNDQPFISEVDAYNGRCQPFDGTLPRKGLATPMVSINFADEWLVVWQDFKTTN